MGIEKSKLAKIASYLGVILLIIGFLDRFHIIELPDFIWILLIGALIIIAVIVAICHIKTLKKGGEEAEELQNFLTKRWQFRFLRHSIFFIVTIVLVILWIFSFIESTSFLSGLFIYAIYMFSGSILIIVGVGWAIYISKKEGIYWAKLEKGSELYEKAKRKLLLPSIVTIIGLMIILLNIVIFR